MYKTVSLRLLTTNAGVNVLAVAGYKGLCYLANFSTTSKHCQKVPREAYPSWLGGWFSDKQKFCPAIKRYYVV